MENSILLTKILAFWYGILSLFLFSLYGLDKKQAIIGGRRIPEKVLHIMALAGGFFGGVIGRVFFRHKTRKPFFLIVFGLSIVLHAAAWLAWINR